MIIGVDLDNTLACYDELFHLAACDERLIDPGMPKSKEKIRDAIRLLPDGESQWTRLQAIVYGPRMPEAALFNGVDVFFRDCAAANIRTPIISHKTQSATLDGKTVDLRKAALDWLEKNCFQADFGLSRRDVFFESTRSEKIARIGLLHCTHYIDDLAEVFAEDDFPPKTRKLLFAPHGTGFTRPDVQAFKSWRDLDRFFFP